MSFREKMKASDPVAVSQNEAGLGLAGCPPVMQTFLVGCASGSET